MRNIALSDFKSLQLDKLDNCEAVCYYRNYVYVYNKGKIFKSEETNVEVISNLTLNLYPINDEDDIPKALDITYCWEKDLLYLVLSNGDIISLQVNELDSENIVGSVDGGLKAAQWSPNEEVIALVTGNDNVMVMTQDFDPISEVSLHGGSFGEKQFITVGWGKKETQFRGSEGKFSARDKPIEEFKHSNEDVNVIKMSWRGDAEYFVISCTNPETQQRCLRIFSKNGILQYTSEDLIGLEHPLDWSSSGSLIATTQVLPNKYVVCFFEKNGLKHGDFKLPLSSQEIIVDNVLWNKDSKILALLILKITEKKTMRKCKFLQLYTVSNYHWYCKYTINFYPYAEPLVIKWDNQKSNTLNVIIKKENKIHYNKYSWLWTVNKSKGSGSEDESLVGVIDGCSLKVTCFKRGIIPPPMCTHEIQLSAPINMITFAPDVLGFISSNDLFVQLSTGDLLLFKFVDNGSKGISYKLMNELKNFWNNFEICFNICWVETNTFVLCVVKTNDCKSKPYLTVLNVNNIESLKWDFEKKDIPLQSSIALIKSSESIVLIHTNDGNIFSFNKTTCELVMFCSNKKTLIDMDVKDKENGSWDFLCLDNLNKFYVNNNVLLNNVLSFHIHENFIILTTLKHELLCINADTEIMNNELCTRRVERGSRIVTSIHKDSKVILQMPRGNLECVQPRALSLFVLGKHLDSLNYFNAFVLMRKQRINLNLLYDYNPVLFSKNIDKFLEEITDLQWISLFLSDLSDEDVTQTMYSNIFKNKNNEVNWVNKIDIVCTLIEKVLTQKQNSDKYILPILMCYIKIGKTEYLETALLKLKELREKEQNGIKSTVTFDEAFKYVLYLIDVEELYKVALGMYDFDLVLAIAGKSQKDPKEYLEFLNELNQLEPNYQRFRIDKYLKRYEKALANLVQCDGDDVFNECLNFIKSHKLYRPALKLIPENTDRYKNICMCYGDELLNDHQYEEAGFMYSKAGSFKNALEAYRKAGNWQEVLFCARQLQLYEHELSELYLDLAMELSEFKRFKESATVYLDYLKDVEECVKSLSKGKLFAEAYRICHLYQHKNLINQVIIPEIIEQGNLMQLHIESLCNTFVNQKKRLQVVRKAKLEAEGRKIDCEDFYSETNTIITQSNAVSRTTNKTYRSAKNRRKQERKLLSLKEGSPYEDLALVTSLHNIATNCVALKSDVKELNKFLIKISQFEMAEKLQKELKSLLKIIETSKTEIWTSDLLNSRQFYGPESTSNEISAMYIRSECVSPVPINPKYAVPPETQNNEKWELEILNS